MFFLLVRLLLRFGGGEMILLLLVPVAYHILQVPVLASRYHDSINLLVSFGFLCVWYATPLWFSFANSTHREKPHKSGC